MYNADWAVIAFLAESDGRKEPQYICSLNLRHWSNQDSAVPAVFWEVFHIGGVTKEYQWKDRGGESFVWGVFIVYWGLANDGYNSRANAEGIFVGKKMISWRAHHSGSVIIWPTIGLNPYYTLLSIQTKRLHHTMIRFMRTGRRCTCGIRTRTSILPQMDDMSWWLHVILVQQLHLYRVYVCASETLDILEWVSQWWGYQWLIVDTDKASLGIGAGFRIFC